MKRILLAYSGSLETSAAIPWLADRHGAEVVTFTVDLGLGQSLQDVRERALACGAAAAHVVDARERFAGDFILPALQAGALAAARSPLSKALSRPLLAGLLTERAAVEGADAIAHGAVDFDGDRQRLEHLLHAIAPEREVLAPVATWRMGRDALDAFARGRGIAARSASGPRVDTTLWARVIDGPETAHRWQDLPAPLFDLTRPVDAAPTESASVDIAFESGVPVSVNGVSMSLLELVQCLEVIAGVHGVGRSDRTEARGSGRLEHQVFEAPAARTLVAAHEALQRAVLPAGSRPAASLGTAYADLVERGGWFTAERETMDALVACLQPRVTGVVRLRLGRGECQAVACQSPFASSAGSPLKVGASA